MILLKEVCFYLLEIHKGVYKGEMICLVYFEDLRGKSEEQIKQDQSNAGDS